MRLAMVALMLVIPTATAQMGWGPMEVERIEGPYLLEPGTGFEIRVEVLYECQRYDELEELILIPNATARLENGESIALSDPGHQVVDTDGCAQREREEIIDLRYSGVVPDDIDRDVLILDFSAHFEARESPSSRSDSPALSASHLIPIQRVEEEPLLDEPIEPLDQRAPGLPAALLLAGLAAVTRRSQR